MKYLILVFFVSGVILLASCGQKREKPVSAELLTDDSKRDTIFSQLIRVINPVETNMGDSLAFLILPLDASCPSCRDKTIDSIAKHSLSLRKNHFVILSSHYGIKSMRGYFKDRGKSFPIAEKWLTLDSNNIAGSFKLYEENPTIYYTFGKKPYKKISALPETVKQDLHEFFSGENLKE